MIDFLSSGNHCNASGAKPTRTVQKCGPWSERHKTSFSAGKIAVTVGLHDNFYLLFPNNKEKIEKNSLHLFQKHSKITRLHIEQLDTDY